MGFEVIGTGHFVPGEPITNAALARVMDTSDEWIFQRSGIRQRHFAGEGQGASDLALEATKRALEMANIKATDLDYILFATMTPDYVFPGSAAVLAAKLGLEGTPALDIRQQCAAMIFALQLIDGLIKGGAAKTILFVGAEAHAGFMPWEDWDIVEGKRVGEPTPEARARANEHRALAVLFGDGAGAMIFRATDRDAGLVAAKVHTDGRYAETLYVPGGGFRTRPYWKATHFDEQAHPPYGRARALQIRGHEAPADGAQALRGDQDADRVDRLVSGPPSQRAHQQLRARAPRRSAREDADEHRPFWQHQRGNAPDPDRRVHTRRKAEEGRAEHDARPRRRHPLGLRAGSLVNTRDHQRSDAPEAC